VAYIKEVFFIIRVFKYNFTRVLTQNSVLGTFFLSTVLGTLCQNHSTVSVLGTMSLITTVSVLGTLSLIPKRYIF
jgi:hypothetical protein